MSDFYQFSARHPVSGREVQMKEFQGKYVLVVNTASQCGFTPQYRGLEKLYRKYKDQGLVILGFPCNQFGGQEPGSDSEIAQFCATHYDVTFPIMEKVKVNGKDAHPLFKYLKKTLSGLLGGRIKWNFTKFLISPQGEPLKRWGSAQAPEKIESYLKERITIAERQ